MNTQTVTVNGQEGEVLVFKLAFETPFTEFLENVDMIVSPECIQDGVDMNLWSIV